MLGRRVLVVVAVAAASLTAVASDARMGEAASAAAASCASLANVTGFSGTVRFAFSGNATGVDQDSGDHLAITLDRSANSIGVNLNQKLTGLNGIVQFIGHAHGGLIVEQDSSTLGQPKDLPYGPNLRRGLAD
jgi:hypothetical protein